MTKKDFELIAQTIRELDADDIGGDEGKQYITEYFAIKLAATNHKFKPVVFLTACGCAPQA